MKLVSLKGLDTKTADKESARFHIAMLTQRIRIEKNGAKIFFVENDDGRNLGLIGISKKDDKEIQEIAFPLDATEKEMDNVRNYLSEELGMRWERKIEMDPRILYPNFYDRR